MYKYLNALPIVIYIILLFYPKIIEICNDIYGDFNYKRVFVGQFNTVVLRGEITNTSVATIIKKINNLPFVKVPLKNTTVNLLIDSNGGNVIEGFKIILKILALEKKKDIF